MSDPSESDFKTKCRYWRDLQRRRRALLTAVNRVVEPERAAEPRLAASDRCQLSETEDEEAAKQREEVERAAAAVRRREQRFIKQTKAPPRPTPVFSEQPPPFSAALSELMLCVGDWPAPRPESVALLEALLAREVTALARRTCASPLPHDRQLRMEHLLWATRRDPVITQRIFDYLELCALRTSVRQEAEPEQLEHTALLAHCREFCHQLGTASQRAEDAEAAARRARLDRLTRAMSGAQYDAFASVRGSATYRIKYCRAWLESRWPPGAPPADLTVVGVLLFLIREMVALLVDACLLVRAEQRPDGPGLPAESVAPDHVREAVRRLQMAAPARADMLLIR